MQDTPPFVVDLHAHFPMQFDPEQRYRHAFRARIHRQGERFLDKLKFAILAFADKYWNRSSPSSGHAVTIDTLSAGNVGLALSVAYLPFEELDLGAPYASPPTEESFKKLEDLLHVVEHKVKEDGRAEVVRTFADFEAVHAAGKVALIHAVEGGFHMGGSDANIAANVARLASRGAGYITVAHLFYRQVATNCAALPFLPDVLYRELFPMPRGLGLASAGKTLVREMVRHGILVDLTHMSEESMADTFALLDEIDPKKTVPVIATHVACSFGRYAYNLKKEWVQRIAERKGVAGIIYCDHFMREKGGRPKQPSFDDTLHLIDAQIATLRDWGGDDVLAIGSDLDGFIQPSLAGLETAADHRKLASALEQRYGAPLARKICHENALRVFEAAWMKPFPVP